MVYGLIITGSALALDASNRANFDQERYNEYSRLNPEFAFNDSHLIRPLKAINDWDQSSDEEDSDEEDSDEDSDEDSEFFD
ncbi:MAG: hypothetical protein LBH08_00945 [Puniceicoccales bacterium]|nr:hypothetical protein [Puniceicoccales bacterium]